MNETKPKIGCLLSLVLALGMSGCFFHHSHRRDNNNDNEENSAPVTSSHSGSHNMPRNRASDLSDMIRDPDRHMGQFVSTYGPVRTIEHRPNGATVFQITTPNYAYLFIVSFPGDIPNLEVGKDTYFLGTVAGVQAVGDVQGLVVEGIAIQTTGGRGLNPYAWPKAIYVPGQEEVTAAWLNGSLDLLQSRPSPVRQYAQMAPAASPAPSYFPSPAPPPSVQAPYYPPAPAPAPAPPAPGWQGGGGGSLDSVGLIKVAQKWNELPPEAKERILGIVSQYSR